MTDEPILLVWEGDGFKPASAYWQSRADKHFVIGERYMMEEVHQRSQASHNHYFAAVEEAWRNLPEDLAQRFPTSEHLRKYALIRTGFCNEQHVVFMTRKDAERAAALIIPLDEFSVIDVRDTTVARYTAKSQRRRAMDKQEFQASKDAVLGLLSEMIGTSPKQLEHHAGMAA